MNRQTQATMPGTSEPLVSAEHDYYTWALQQAHLLEAGHFALADMPAIAEEIRDLGRSQYDALESALRIVLLHLLKWDHQPGLRSRSWLHSIEAQRLQITRRLRKNPGLKSRLAEAMQDAYADARLEAAIETGLSVEIFPDENPYDLGEILDRQITHPDDVR